MNEWVSAKRRMEVVSSNSVGSWYRSGTKTYVQHDLRQKIPRVDGSSTGPSEIRVS